MAPATVVDLGCGAGPLTASLHLRWPAAQILGVDNDDAMLARTADHTSATVHFDRGDIRGPGHRRRPST